jgi:resuscitation-promoting factor RpfB
VTRRDAGQTTGRRTGKAGARTFAVVTTVGIAALALALMFGSAGRASPDGAPGAQPSVGSTTVSPTRTSPSPSDTTTSTPTPTPTPTPMTESDVTTTVTEVVAIPFAKQTLDDGALAKGKTVVRTAGRDGSKTVTWLVRTRSGIEVSRTLSGEQVTRAPVTEVTAVGTKAPTAASTPKPAPTTAASSASCDPNYSGACVPIASDVDCAGGSGNGPAYVRGPVQVVGTDVYGLDSDSDGIGCE